MLIQEEIQILLSGRNYLYSLFQNIFGNEPNKEQMDIVTSEQTAIALSLYQTSKNTVYSSLLSKWQEFCEDYQQEKSFILEKLKSDYTKLFIGPGRLPAPPWESVFLSKERLLFQESTLKVRRWYLKYNFVPSDYPHVADDHISFELDFMARLSGNSFSYYNERKQTDFHSLLVDQKKFLSDHLLKWVPDFARQLQNAKTGIFYPLAALLLEQFLKTDKSAIDELLTELNKMVNRIIAD